MFPDFKSSFSIYSYTVLTSIFNQFPTIPDPYHALNGLRKYAIWFYICIKIIEFAISSTNLPIRICNPFLNRSRVPGLLKKYKKIISSKIVYYIMLRNSIFFSMFSLHISSHWVFTVNAETDSVWRWLC